MHVPSGLFVYGLYQNEQNDGTQWKPELQRQHWTKLSVDSAANENDVWYVKAGIKRAWMPAGATVLFGEWGQYNDMFTGLCGVPGAAGQSRTTARSLCISQYLPIGVVRAAIG